MFLFDNLSCSKFKYDKWYMVEKEVLINII